MRLIGLAVILTLSDACRRGPTGEDLPGNKYPAGAPSPTEAGRRSNRGSTRDEDLTSFGFEDVGLVRHRSWKRFLEGARRRPLHGSPNVAVRRHGLDMEERG